jgi:hypothetical protein
MSNHALLLCVPFDRLKDDSPACVPEAMARPLKDR